MMDSVALMKRDREDEKKMLPCRFFSRGYCVKGTHCKFSHLIENHLTIKVPNLPNHPHFVRRSNNFDFMDQVDFGCLERRVRPRANKIEQMNVLDNYSPPRSDSKEKKSNGVLFEALNGKKSSSESSESSPDETQQEIAEEADEEDPKPPSVFKHIDWRQFLAPGYLPPPPSTLPIDKDKTNKLKAAVLERANGEADIKLTPKEEFFLKLNQASFVDEEGKGDHLHIPTFPTTN